MKRIKYIAFSIIALLAFNNKVFAGAYISTDKSQVTPESTFTVTAGVSGVASWNVHVSASGPVSGCTINAADATESATNGSKSYSVTCKATGTGTITLRLSGDTTTESGANSAISGTRTVSVIARPSGGGVTPSRTTPTTPKRTEPTKSSNTKLEEFGVKGYSISPEFSNDNNNYSLTVPFDTTNITIYTSRTSDKQKVSGNGDKEVKTGDNKFEVVVTAEDGTKRTINLNVNVDTKPITIKLDGKDYTVIKKKEELPNLDILHEDMPLTIQEQDVSAYRIDKIGYILIGLKNNEGKVQLYKFDSYKNNEKEPTYELFNYLKIKDMNLVILEFPTKKIPSGYKKYTEKIGDTEYTVYKLDKDSKYGLIYATNAETGKTNIYKYEKSENTIQIYEKLTKKATVDKTEKYKKLILIMGATIIILVLLTTIGFTKKPKDKKQEKSKSENSLTKKDIKKIEKTTKKDEKKNKKKQKKGEPEF